MDKFELLELKITSLSENIWFRRQNVTISFKWGLWGSCEQTCAATCLKWGSCEWQERHEKGVLKAAYPYGCYVAPESGQKACVWTMFTVEWQFEWHTVVLNVRMSVQQPKQGLATLKGCCYFDASRATLFGILTRNNEDSFQNMHEMHINLESVWLRESFSTWL